MVEYCIGVKPCNSNTDSVPLNTQQPLTICVYNCTDYNDLHYIPEAQKFVVLKMHLQGMTEKNIMKAMGMGWEQ